jgi:hypothetical protein
VMRDDDAPKRTRPHGRCCRPSSLLLPAMGELGFVGIAGSGSGRWAGVGRGRDNRH